MSSRLAPPLCLGLCILNAPWSMAATEPHPDFVPSKNAPSQKGFDFRRPTVGEILPNPPSGSGPPPSLKEYAPANPSEAFSPGAVSSVPHPHTSKTADRIAGPAAALGPETAAAANTTGGIIALQTAFAAQIVRRGIHAAFSFLPDNIPSKDPTDLKRWQNWKQTLGAAQAARTAAKSSDVRVEVEPGAVTLLQAPVRVTGAVDVPQHP